MAERSPLTWLITGCSRGLGRALAGEVLARGDRLIATARNEAVLADLDHAGASLLSLPLDVSISGAAADTVRKGENMFGPVDVLVNNAGYAFLGGVEETLPDEQRQLFDTNFFGAAEVMRAVLPGMRARKFGRIVNISSTATADPSPGLGYYAATKAALAALSEALAKEVGDFGIAVTIVELGGHRTEALKRLTHAEGMMSEYSHSIGQTRNRFHERSGNQPGDPVLAARSIIAAVCATVPPLHLPLGEDALARTYARLQRSSEETERWKHLAATATG